MENKINKTILGGLIGTALMTILTLIAPMMGMPKMSPPHLLASMMGFPEIMGWVMHFMIGVIFAFGYTYWLSSRIKIENIYVKGILFGIIVFVFAQIMMAMMGAMLPMPKMEGSMFLSLMGSLLGHIIYGIGVTQTINQ